MNIKQIKEKYKNFKPDTILEKNLELLVKVKTPFIYNDIILEDDSGSIEALARQDIRIILKSKAESREETKLKGLLVKSPFEDISFEIEEILE